MRQGLLLGMAIALALSLPAVAATSVSNGDSIIIDNVIAAQGQSQVLVPVYFVEQQIAPSLADWDDNWQGISTDGTQALNLGFADLGGESNPSLNTEGQRVLAFNLSFSIDDNPPAQVVNIRPRVDQRAEKVDHRAPPSRAAIACITRP